MQTKIYPSLIITLITLLDISHLNSDLVSFLPAKSKSIRNIYFSYYSMFIFIVTLGGLDVEEFGQAMKMAFGNSEELDDRQLEIMFMKVDTNCDGTVDWEEFCSYMLLENQQKDSMSRDYIDLPFPNPAREVQSPHHDSLAR